MTPNFIFKNFTGLISVYADQKWFQIQHISKILIINIIRHHETNLQPTYCQYETNLLPTCNQYVTKMKPKSTNYFDFLKYIEIGSKLFNK
jgi:hypothetical protein